MKKMKDTGRWHTSPSLLCLAAFSHRLSRTFFGMNETWEAVKCRTSQFQNSAMHTFIIKQYNQVLNKYPTAVAEFWRECQAAGRSSPATEIMAWKQGKCLFFLNAGFRGNMLCHTAICCTIMQYKIIWILNHAVKLFSPSCCWCCFPKAREDDLPVASVTTPAGPKFSRFRRISRWYCMVMAGSSLNGSCSLDILDTVLCRLFWSNEIRWRGSTWSPFTRVILQKWTGHRQDHSNGHLPNSSLFKYDHSISKGP